jgi:hypothetical protein
MLETTTDEIADNIFRISTFIPDAHSARLGRSRFVIGVLFARPDRRTDLREGMEQTLQRLRDAVEHAHDPSRH